MAAETLGSADRASEQGREGRSRYAAQGIYRFDRHVTIIVWLDGLWACGPTN
jgi:hypothetical protein